MIQEIVAAIANELNGYFKLKFGVNENKLVLSNIIDQDGSVAIKSENKVILSIVNITKDGTRGGGMGQNGHNQPTDICMYLLFTAYFNPENYLEALKFLSGVVGFFQVKGMLNHRTLPQLPNHIDPIKVEIVKLSFDELSNMWSAIGAKYMPSVVYRIRSLSVQDSRIRNIDPVLKGY
ncbi:MAG: DUF4255 domain-containing protein [Bacteroidota bacterium]